MQKGKRIYLATHDAAWFRKGIWNKLSLNLRFNRFILVIQPEKEKERIQAGEVTQSEGEKEDIFANL